MNRNLLPLSLLLLALPIFGCATLASTGVFLPAIVYLVATPLTYWAYQHDKQQAQLGQWRTPEARLQLLSLLGGWFGAFYAQQKLRHKNRKTSFQIVFWAIVALHQAAWAFFLYPNFLHA